MTKPASTITGQTCDAFASAADALLVQRAHRIPERDIDDFVALGWMDWHGGSLRVTPLGQTVLMKIRTRLIETVA